MPVTHDLWMPIISRQEHGSKVTVPEALKHRVIAFIVIPERDQTQ